MHLISKRSIGSLRLTITAIVVTLQEYNGHTGPVLTMEILQIVKALGFFLVLYLTVFYLDIYSNVERHISSMASVSSRPATSDTRTHWPPSVTNLRSGWQQCEVPVDNNTSGHRTSLPVCSASTYLSEMSRVGYFPGRGRWVASTTSYTFLYQPSFCRGLDSYWNPQDTLPESVVAQCLLQRHTKHVLLMGDSHIALYVRSLLSILKSHGYNCKLMKKERSGKGEVDARYYRIPGNDFTDFLSAGIRRCTTCSGRMYRCTSPSHRVTVEQLPLNFIIDSVLSVRKPNDEQFPAGSSQELMLRHYIRYNPPNVVIIAPPFQHEVHLERNTHVKVHEDLVYLMSLLEMYLPNSTFVWIPAGSIFHKERFHKYKDLEPTEHIHMMNRALFDVLNHRLRKQNPKHFCLFDIASLTCSLAQYVDQIGVHYQQFMYDNIMTFVLQIVCQNNESVE